MAGCEIHSVFAGIAGSHVRSLNSHGVVAIRDKEVTHGDVEHVIECRESGRNPCGSERSSMCCHRKFIVDARKVSATPIGMSGVAAGGQGSHRDRRDKRGTEHREVAFSAAAWKSMTLVLEQLASSFARAGPRMRRVGCLPRGHRRWHD